MKKIILVDGNNLLFRSYYATAYQGSLLKNSKGLPTNALYGFVGMMEKIIKEEKPEYIAVAFDIGKNFRKEKYSFYKEGRQKTPQELHVQEPYARKILKAMHIPYFELAPYEADDIIGTLARIAEIDPDFVGTIVSSDRDLLQLISPQIEMKLLKQKDFIRYDLKGFQDAYHFDPVHIIDLKALAGDPSDNIPGVKGVGDKTALTLIEKYQTIENLYDHIDEIKGKLKEKLVSDKDNAFMSKEIATIYKEVPLEIKDLEDLKYDDTSSSQLYDLFKELEFYSFLKDFKKETKQERTIKVIKMGEEIEEANEYAFYLALTEENYHNASIVGMGLSTMHETYFVEPSLISSVLKKINDKVLYTYDYKKAIVSLQKIGITCPKVNTDLMTSYALLKDGSKDDLAIYALSKGYNFTPETTFWKNLMRPLSKELEEEIALKSAFIMESREQAILDLKLNDMLDLFMNIEMPLTPVLADMEITGMKVDRKVLDLLKVEYKTKLDTLSHEIYDLAGEKFNISSPKQLGIVLFEHMGLPVPKKNETGFKTDVKVLHKLEDVHPIIAKILEYRAASKIASTYLEGLEVYIKEDGCIHTIFKQNYARTGRLSSTEPNLQNIPTKDDEGRRVRLAFSPKNDCYLSADYSQIELRILAHISNCQELIEAFNNGEDIHTKVAADIHGIPVSEVTKKMRSTAKAVIFGIVYGISGYGLGENLSISPKEAKAFIDKYYELYPGVKAYMDNIVEEAKNNGSVRTLFNRERVIPELSSPQFMVRQSGERIALNTPIQGTSADIIKKAMVEIQAKLNEAHLKTKMVLQIHDELLFDVMNDEKEMVERIVKDTMEHTIQLKVPLKVSADYGVNWYDTK